MTGPRNTAAITRSNPSSVHESSARPSPPFSRPTFRDFSEGERPQSVYPRVHVAAQLIVVPNEFSGVHRVDGGLGVAGALACKPAGVASSASCVQVKKEHL